MSLFPSADFISKAFAHMPCRLISFPKDEGGLICVQGSLFKLILPLLVVMGEGFSGSFHGEEGC